MSCLITHNYNGWSHVVVDSAFPKGMALTESGMSWLSCETVGGNMMHAHNTETCTM